MLGASVEGPNHRGDVMPDSFVRKQPRQLTPEVMDLVYDELRGIAQRILRGQHDERSLGATGLVHEAVERLLASEGYTAGACPSAVLGMTTRVMGHVLVDRARERRSLKRGGDRRRLSMDSILEAMAPPEFDFEDLYEALERLGERHERLGRVVRLRYLVGLSNAEVAEIEGISLRAVEANLQAARIALYQALSGEG